MDTESAGFVRGFVRMCDDGWRQGWHERNGGNATYRLTAEEVEATRASFAEAPGAWTPLAQQAQDPSLGGMFFLATASGSYMRNVSQDVDHALGIVEISPQADAYRVVWGFSHGARPTSEFAGHLLIHAARMRADGGKTRVVYHAHPVSVIALSKVLPPESRAFTRALWVAMTECVMVFPEGIGVVGFEVPGSMELAVASAAQAQRHRSVVWAHHGLLSCGDTFDDAFGREHAIVKAAEIHIQARLLNGGSDCFPNAVKDDQLRAIAASLGLAINEDFLG